MLNRRSVLALGAAAIALPSASFAAETVDYAPGVVENALAEGKTVFVDFAADWCSTCARQERVIGALRSENPAYNDMLFVRVDWDDYRNHEVTTSRNIPRRSTLIVLKGDQELGRLVAGTGEAQIKELLDLGLNSLS
ncbi:thioredoxin family protein [Pseudaestuariivita sp.]|uniref:thioredoxin family protein n=1 Tax=Pseudaestuariivita sp. TaxID=2211669 RepID=UPI00405877F0